jgi:hypothetical protein
LPAPSWRDFFNGAERADRELEVHWSTNAMAREIWSSQAIPSLASKLPGAGSNAKVLEERSVGDDRWLYVVGTESTPVGIGVVNCDPRFALVVSYVRYVDRVRLAEALTRIIESVRCAVTDANRARPIAATRLPSKFGRVVDPDAQFYRSIDGEYLAITVGNDNVQRNPETFRTIVQATASVVFGAQIHPWEFVQHPTPERNASIMRATIPVSGKKVYMGALYCVPGNLSLMTFWFGPDTNDELARERFSQVGCPGEVSTTPTDFAALAKSACASGDQAACELSATVP